MIPAIPRATYRLQLNRSFSFADATALVPYLSDLGISHCYVSPLLMSRPGSLHGYDIVDHLRLDPELGSREDFNRLTDTLREHRMGLIVDVVPNHMAIGGSDNSWWLDVLENGPSSPRASYFDIEWKPVAGYLRGKVLLPILGDHYGNVLARGEISLQYDERQGSFHALYFDHQLPIDPKTYPHILKVLLTILVDQPASEIQAERLRTLIAAFAALPSRNRTSRRLKELRRHAQSELKLRLARLASESAIRRALALTLALFNTPDTATAEKLPQLHRLLNKQAYHLAYWRVAADDINYRRFFNINALAGLRMERSEVFYQTHRLILELIAEDRIQGLRIDHIDGLFDPLAYLERLTAETGKRGKTSLYLVVEKILAEFESLPGGWPVSGTTGYDFAGLANAYLVAPDGESPLSRTYRSFTDQASSYEDQVHAAKKLIIRLQLASELHVLANLLRRIAEKNLQSRDYTLNSLREALVEIVTGFPVYRTYVTPGRIAESDRQYITWTVNWARNRSRAADTSIFDIIREPLLRAGTTPPKTTEYSEAIRFAMKFQQYTAPVMAKAVEDTVFYRYNRLVSLNEVGGEPRRFGISMAVFHRANQVRSQSWPHSMLTTSTHDSKRSEDVRARITVLSEIPKLWHAQVFRWRVLNRPHRRKLLDTHAPDRNDEYLFYQTLVGIWPVGKVGEDIQSHLRERLESYMIKAVREAKVHSSWLNPNREYEEAVLHFVRASLKPGENSRFLAELSAFLRQMVKYGLLNSLAQTLLKLTVPGIPDFYQGNELWTFALVDPDNRHPVDFRERREMLSSLHDLLQTADDRAQAVQSLLRNLEDGRIKMFLIWQTLQLRNTYPDLFARGEYLPLQVDEPFRESLCVFARQFEGKRIIALVPRYFARQEIFDHSGERAGPPDPSRHRIRINLPADETGSPYTELFTGNSVSPVEEGNHYWLPAWPILSAFPFALLVKIDHGDAMRSFSR